MPPENTPGYTPAPPPAPNRSWLRIVLAILVVIILIVLVYGAYLLWQSKGGSNGTYFSLYENGKVNWYTLKGNQVYPEPGPLAQDKRTPKVLEAAPVLTSGDTPVIAVAGAGTQVGYFYRGGVFKSLVSDGNQQAGISDLPDGTIAYSELVDGKWQLHTLSAFDASSRINNLGEGMGAAFTKDNSLIALSSEGIIHASISGGQFPIVADAGIPYGTGAVAPDAATAIIPTGAGEIEVFSINPSRSNAATLVGSVQADDTSATFITPTEFVLRNKNTFTMYTISGKTITQSGTAALHQ